MKPPQEPQKTSAEAALRHARRVVVFVIGSTVCLLGVAMLVLPGPGILGMAGGLVILASEFGWARSWLRRAREALGAGNDESA